MRTDFKHIASFVTMATLIFIGMTVLLVGGISTGPNEIYSLGLTGWLSILKRHTTFSINAFSFFSLLLEISVALALTGLLSLLLRRRAA
jgi:hypothetical protein